MLIKEHTYYKRSFQSGRIGHNPTDPPGKPKSPNSRKVKVNEILILDQKENYKVRLRKKDHTEENSKAKGYIRINCETQSTHCNEIKPSLNVANMLKNTVLISYNIFQQTHTLMLTLHIK